MISVVMPVLNGADTLADALASAADAGAGEIVVVEGGSSDGSREIAAGVEIVRLIDQVGPELPDAFNEGIAAARGDHLGFLGHDDLYEEGALQALREELGEAAAVFGRLRYELLDGRPPPGFRTELLGALHDALQFEAMLVPRATFDRVGPLRYQTAHDVDWMARLRESELEVRRSEVLVARKRIREESQGHKDTLREPERLVQILHDSVERRRSETG